jgi:hypothetical protein
MEVWVNEIVQTRLLPREKENSETHIQIEIAESSINKRVKFHLSSAISPPLRLFFIFIVLALQ